MGGQHRHVHLLPKAIGKPSPLLAPGLLRSASAGCYEEIDGMDTASSNGGVRRWRQSLAMQKLMVHPFNLTSGPTAIFEACSWGSPRNVHRCVASFLVHTPAAHPTGEKWDGFSCNGMMYSFVSCISNCKCLL